jgi:hypothetical protein
MADYYNLTNSQLTFVSYNSSNVLPVPPNGSGQNMVANNGAARGSGGESLPPAKAGAEGFDFKGNYIMATGLPTTTYGQAVSADLPTATSAQVYDMDPKGNLMNYPVGHPKYQPSFQDTRMQDALALQQQENTLFMIGSVAGVSLVLLSFMIFKSQSSE